MSVTVSLNFNKMFRFVKRFGRHFIPPTSYLSNYDGTWTYIKRYGEDKRIAYVADGGENLQERTISVLYPKSGCVYCFGEEIEFNITEMTQEEKLDRIEIFILNEMAKKAKEITVIKT